MRLTITVDIDKEGKVAVDVQSDEQPEIKKPVAKIPKPHTCSQCGGDYLRYRSDSNFCSKKCYQRYYNISHGRIKSQLQTQAQQVVITPSRAERAAIEFRPAPISAVPLRRTDDSLESTFGDPWNCMQCRENSALCKLHTGLVADGKQPPQFHHYRH